MKHDFIDQDAYLHSPVHHLDARAKIVGLLGGIVICVSTPPQAYWAFVCYGLVVLAVVALARLPVKRLLRKALVVVPFALMVAAFAPFLPHDRPAGRYNVGITGAIALVSPAMVVWNVLVKSALSILMALLLTSTTPFPSLLHGLRRLGLPDVMVMLLSFAYRYLFVLIDEFERLTRAHDARGYRGRWLWHASALGNLVGSLFIRTYERAERIYVAMISRGFEGRFPHLPARPLRLADGVFMAVFLGPILASRMILS
jgi:cobalt/nickel transport system permease protein